MVVTRKNIDELQLAVQLVIDNIEANAEVKTRMEGYGYTPERLNEGKVLLANVRTAVEQHSTLYSNQYSATDALKSKWKVAKKTYMNFVKVSRIALSDDRAAYHKLGLKGNREQNLSAWLAQARQFYTGAIGDDAILTKLAVFAITKEKLEAGLLLVTETEKAINQQKSSIGDAQKATMDRNEVAEKMDRYKRDLLKVAKIALGDDPQLLEKLGVVV